MVTPTSLISDATFVLDLLSGNGQNVDIVGLYTNNSNASGSTTGGLSLGVVNSIFGLSNVSAGFGQLFVNARPLKATIRETSKVMEHPVETGSMIADFHIINPVEIDIPLIVQSQYYSTVYTQIRQYFINATPMSVKTRTGVYNNMIIADMPHEEEAEMYDVISIALHLRQVLLYTPGSLSAQSSYQPLAAANSNTISSGLQSAIGLSTQALTTATSIASYASVIGKFK